MPHPAVSVYPIRATVQHEAFDLVQMLVDCLDTAELALQDGDVLAISSKYAAISQGRVVNMADIIVSERAAALAERYAMNPHMVELVIREANHVFGGIVHEYNGTHGGFLLTQSDGIISANAGLDRSNIPAGKVVLFPKEPYRTAAEIRQKLRDRLDINLGIVLTDSWLMPGRAGTTGVALATAGFLPVRDVRGDADLFGNPMQVTQVGVADTLAISAQMVMGETDQATPFALIRGSDVELIDREISVADVAIDWEIDIYIGALTVGLLPDGAPRQSPTERYIRQSLRTNIADG